jgi:hypothetical protein
MFALKEKLIKNRDKTYHLKEMAALTSTPLSLTLSKHRSNRKADYCR